VKLIDTSDGDKVSAASLIELQVDATTNGTGSNLPNLIDIDEE